MAHDRENGKCYFGSTFQTLEKRIKQHESLSKKQTARGHFYNALAFRPEKFFWLVLQELHTTNRSAEQEYLDKFFKLDWCYNVKNTADGAGFGESNCGRNPETVAKRSKKYKESVKNGSHLFQQDEFKSQNSQFQKELLNRKTHNFSASQGKGINNAFCNKALWKRYDKLKTLWMYYGCPKEHKFASILNYKKSSLRRIVESFFRDIV